MAAAMKLLSKFKKICTKCNVLKFNEIVIKNSNEFCRNTTLHGLKYVADDQLKSSERCFFGISIVTVVIIAVYLIVRVYDKWATTPVIFGINPEPTIITNEPFPAVTICNLNQALASKVFNFSKNSPEYEMLQLLCKREVNTTVVQTITNWNNMESFIINISQSCEDMLVDCRFGGVVYNCSHLFYPLVTDEGFCCVFNMLHPIFMYASHIPISFHNLSNFTRHKPVNWYSELGYPHELPQYYYPQKVPGVGESLGLSVTLDVEKDKYYCSSSSSVGFKFSLHSPNESPNVRETGVFIEPGKETKLRVIPDKIETDLHLRSIYKKFRHCVFHNEKNLKFFAHYTQRNCEMECIAEISHMYCGCVSFFMPKIYENFTVCSLNDQQCERKVRLRTDTSIKSCLDDCLPSCFDLNFQVESFSTKLSHNGFDIINLNVEHMSVMYVEENVAIVHMYFKEHSFRSNIQTEFVGATDFLSSIGGVMDLFLGFSFLSIAELIYYAIIRPCRPTQKNKKSRQKSHDLEAAVSSFPSTKKLRKLLKKRYKTDFHSAKVFKDQDKLFDRNKTHPYVIADGVSNTCEYWLE